MIVLKLNSLIIKSLQSALLLLILLSFVSGSVAQEEAPISAPEMATILVIPAGFQKSYEDKFEHVVLKSAETYIRDNSRGILELHSFESFKNKLREKEIYAERIELARGFIALGIDLFQKMDIDGSTKNLAKGLRHFRELGHGFIAPTEVSTALLYLALTRLDESIDVGRVLNIFKEMVLTDPKVLLKEGLYPPNAVAYYKSAKNEINKSTLNGSPDSTLVSRAGELSNATFVANFSILQPETRSPRLLLDIYDTEQSRFVRRFEVELPNLQSEHLQDGANRLMSQFVTCLEEPSELKEMPKKSTGKSPWSLELSFTYVSFLTFPGPDDLEPFGNAGGIIGLGYNFTREFALQFAVEVLTSLRDRNGVISEKFQTIRTFLGSDIGISFGDFKLSVGTFVEGAFIPAVSVCNPTDIRQRSGDCSDTVPADQFGPFLGANLRPKISFRATESISIIASGNSSFYILPFTNSPINFPVSGEFGLKYRF